MDIDDILADGEKIIYRLEGQDRWFSITDKRIITMTKGNKMISWKIGAIVAVVVYELGAVLAYTKVINANQGSLSGLFTLVYRVPFYTLRAIGSVFGLSENASLILANLISLVIFASMGAKIGELVEKRLVRDTDEKNSN